MGPALNLSFWHQDPGSLYLTTHWLIKSMTKSLVWLEPRICRGMLQKISLEENGGAGEWKV